MENIITTGKLKTSSNDAMSISLTDSSTETFWESKDEARSKTRSITVTFNDPTRVFAGCIHIDNQKDAGVSQSFIMYKALLIVLSCIIIAKS